MFLCTRGETPGWNFLEDLLVYEPSSLYPKREISGGVDQVSHLAQSAKSSSLGMIVRYIHTSQCAVEKGQGA